MLIDVIALVKVSISHEKKNCKVDLTNSANFCLLGTSSHLDKIKANLYQDLIYINTH